MVVFRHKRARARMFVGGKRGTWKLVEKGDLIGKNEDLLPMGNFIVHDENPA